MSIEKRAWENQFWEQIYLWAMVSNIFNYLETFCLFIAFGYLYFVQCSFVSIYICVNKCGSQIIKIIKVSLRLKLKSPWWKATKLYLEQPAIWKILNFFFLNQDRKYILSIIKKKMKNSTFDFIFLSFK